ncbi:MAG: 50S ribosomal protein L15 [Sandaracinaceae bacterium]|nr:50S ribosomal protein L15 [Sandaracinaceae bacterium]
MADSDKEVPVLSRLRPPAGAVKKRTRFGRGIGSGLGKTAGRGQKGQKARQPGNIHKRHLEGGQIPLQRRLPKFGFNHIFSVVVAEVNVRDLNRFDAGATVDADALRAEGLIKGRFDVLKVLGHGEIDRKLTVKAHKFSASARAKIEAAGGAVEEIAIEA